MSLTQYIRTNGNIRFLKNDYFNSVREFLRISSISWGENIVNALETDNIIEKL